MLFRAFITTLMFCLFLTSSYDANAVIIGKRCGLLLGAVTLAGIGWMNLPSLAEAEFRRLSMDLERYTANLSDEPRGISVRLSTSSEESWRHTEQDKELAVRAVQEVTNLYKLEQLSHPGAIEEIVFLRTKHSQRIEEGSTGAILFLSYMDESSSWMDLFRAAEERSVP